MIGLEKIRQRILTAKDIAITGHINPDGDSIGSILALGLGLETLRKRVYIVSEDGVPKRYKGLAGARRILRRLPTPPDLAICVDCGDKNLLGKTFKTLMKAVTILEIDHHEFRRPFGNMRLIDHKAASVGEMIYMLLHYLGIDITKDIAQNILTSIIVETNSFKLPNVRSVTFYICSQLMKLGVDFYKLSDTVYWSKTKESALLLGMCLTRCKFLKGKAIAWTMVTAKDFKEMGGREEDVDPVADELRSIKDVKIAILFRETKSGMLRVSLRSKGKLNIASIAEKYNGGGHFDAAGCLIQNDQRVIRDLLASVKKLLK